ncbi:MAG: TetR family transcriptional regulator [Hyphomicrobiales bacterium]|nr:TetR family transcriptional regulator [Hyphomicrobiales bacterium]
MNAPNRRTRDDIRNEILTVAWDLFRELGARTTIADIAQRLGMSSANVYRFYSSKQALAEAVCVNQLGNLTEAARAAASGAGAASDRLRAMLLTLHQCMRDQMTNQSRVHEIVDVALREKWPAIETFHEGCAALAAGLVAEGQATGEFGPGDPVLLGMQTLLACASIYHPTLIAECPESEMPQRTGQIVAFALRALANPHPVAVTEESSS